MKRDQNLFYEAVMARDSRFDGKFFVGVKTTGIYCRPICPAKPKKENVEFFSNALAAEKSGYRPCLRCRPESAPLSAAWIGKSAVVQRALKLIATQATDLNHSDTDSINEDSFAESFGMSARHLRRLFQEEIGLTPKQILDHHRLNLSRKLILETSLPFTEIAFTAGYASIRRFNDAIQKRFHRSPTELRGKKSEKLSEGIELTLSYRPPFDWNSLLHYYRSHQIQGVEQLTDESYSRVFKFEDEVGALDLKPSTQVANALQLSVHFESPKYLGKIVQKIREMFDLDSDPLLIANSFSKSKILTELIERYPGLRLPRGWDPFEVSIAAILGQLVSVSQASRLVHQLVNHYGEKIKHPVTGEPAFLFPTPQALAKASLSEIGTTEARKNTIRELARLVDQKKISLDSTQDPALFRKALLEIKGMGPWTVEYISLRALGDTDAFPENDLVLKRVLARHPELDLLSIKPWRAYAAFYFWKK